MIRKPLFNILLSVVICVLFAFIGGALTGNGLEGWFAHLKQPWFALPLSGWYVVGVLYYIMSIIILSRLLSKSEKTIYLKALWLLIGMLAGNEFWNYLFFGLESTYLGFVSLIPFTILVILLCYELRKVDSVSAWILLPYVLWLGYDLFWTYCLWQLNE